MYWVEHSVKVENLQLWWQPYDAYMDTSSGNIGTDRPPLPSQQKVKNKQCSQMDKKSTSILKFLITANILVGIVVSTLHQIPSNLVAWQSIESCHFSEYIYADLWGSIFSKEKSNILEEFFFWNLHIIFSSVLHSYDTQTYTHTPVPLFMFSLPVFSLMLSYKTRTAGLCKSIGRNFRRLWKASQRLFCQHSQAKQMN